MKSICIRVTVLCWFSVHFRLANENEIKEFQTKIREVQKENDELASKLAKKERECEVKDEEQVPFSAAKTGFFAICDLFVTK